MGKSVEEKLQEQEGKLSLLARGLVDVCWVVDLATMQYTYISKTVERTRGFTVEEVMKSQVEDHLAPGSYRTVMTAILDGLKEYETDPDVKKTLEVEVNHKDGGTMWFEVTAQLAKEPDGAMKIVGVTRDISRRKFYELEREKLIGQLQEALEEQKRLNKEIKVLRGLLPICAECKKIRDDNGKWWPIEEYIASRTEADFTHTLCPDCKNKVLAEFRIKKEP